MPPSNLEVAFDYAPLNTLQYASLCFTKRQICPGTVESDRGRSAAYPLPHEFHQRSHLSYRHRHDLCRRKRLPLGRSQIAYFRGGEPTDRADA